MGAQTYKGIVTWQDTFEGETSRNMRATENSKPDVLLKDLMDYASGGILVALEIKLVGSS